MADLIAAGKVTYHPPTATWYLGPEETAVKSRGRALREMRRAGLIQVDERDARADARGAYPVELTDLGKARHRPRQ